MHSIPYVQLRIPLGTFCNCFAFHLPTVRDGRSTRTNGENHNRKLLPTKIEAAPNSISKFPENSWFNFEEIVMLLATKM